MLFWGMMIPFLGTLAGAVCVLFVKKELKPLLQKSLLGFAAGVMVAASVWSLLLPAINMSEGMGSFAFFPAAVGFLVGIFFLLGLDRLIPHLHFGSQETEGPKVSLRRSTMLILAVTIHNIPEGISAGAVFAGYLSGNTAVTLTGAFSLVIGIAIQNIPEGFIVALPVRSERGRRLAFYYGALSGAVEPLFGGITVLLAAKITLVLPYLLSFAAGAMMYVVIEELIPESAEGEHSNIGTIGFSAGFVLMMILDVALG